MWGRIKNWADARLIPSWRVWWKLWSMRLSVVVAAGVSYLTAFPDAFTQAVSMFPPWLRDSLPVWVGPLTLFLLFIVRFWNQRKVPSNEDIRNGNPAP